MGVPLAERNWLQELWASVIGAVPSPIGGTDGAIETVLSAEPITLVALLSILMLRSFASYFARSPLRRGFRAWRPSTWFGSRRAGEVGLLRAWTIRRRLNRALKVLGTGRPLAPATVADLCLRPRPEKHHEFPGDQDAARYLISALRRALAPRSQGLIVRYVVEREWEQHRALLRRVLRYLEQFEQLDRVSYPGARQDAAPNFGDAVSAITGSVVVADLTTSNSGCTESLRVWHSTQWDGRGDPEEVKAVSSAQLRDYRTAYDALVASSADANGEPLVLGMYNGRVPTLLAAEVRQHPGSDGASLVLWTGESDYRSTEPAGFDEQAGYCQDHFQCKKLSTQEKTWPPQIRFIENPGAEGESPAGYRKHRPIGGRLAGEGDRRLLLNAKMGLIVDELDAPQLALMERSARASNGRDVVSQTSGGVMELPVPHDARDSDDYGAVDFLAGLRREVVEELGLDASRYTLAVHAVYVSNTRPRPAPEKEEPASEKEEPASEKEDQARQLKNLQNGETTGTVLAIGSTQLTGAALDERRTKGSPSKGLYESVGLLYVPMGSDARQFMWNLLQGHYCRTHRSWVDQDEGDDGIPAVCCKAAAGENSSRRRAEEHCDPTRLQDRMEQAALMVALYASASRFGPEATLDAYRDVMGDQAWWTTPWPNAPDRGHRRTARDPADFLVGDVRFEDLWKATFQNDLADNASYAGWKSLDTAPGAGSDRS